MRAVTAVRRHGQGSLEREDCCSLLQATDILSGHKLIPYIVRVAHCGTHGGGVFLLGSAIDKAYCRVEIHAPTI